MILLDTNILVQAGIEAADKHERVRNWLGGQFANGVRIGMPWHSVLGFVRLASNQAVFPTGFSVDDAWQEARKWLAAPNVWIPSTTPRHADVISDLLSSAKVGSKDVMDVHLAALAVEHGLTLCSLDTGFERYRGLRVLNPLAA